MLSFLNTLPASIKKGRVCCKVATHSCPPCQCVTYHQKVCRVRLSWISLPEHIAPFFRLGEMTLFTVSIHFFAAWKIKYLISVCARKKKKYFSTPVFFSSLLSTCFKGISPLPLIYTIPVENFTTVSRQHAAVMHTRVWGAIAWISCVLWLILVCGVTSCFSPFTGHTVLSQDPQRKGPVTDPSPLCSFSPAIYLLTAFYTRLICICKACLSQGALMNPPTVSKHCATR